MTETKQKLLSKVEIQTLLNNVSFQNPDPRKILVVAVCDELEKYQGYRLITDQIPSNWNLFKINNELSVFPIVQGG